MQTSASGYDIAVIGLACRFPGARTPSQFWSHLQNGVESVKFFTDQELLAAGETPENLSDPSYVKAQPVLDDFDCFDAGFFGFSPQDAAIMDPQHRLFLEVGWEALEDAGHKPTFAGNIGVFATCGMNSYMMYHLIANRRIMETVGEWLVRHTGNDMNFLATRLSYQLGLKGPSMNVQTACSSALVAIHLASQSLLTGESDMALAGGSTIALPQNRGYLYKQDEILSPDGHCRSFDARARGTLFGSGAGVVVLRRLQDALDDGDRILAVVKGSAVNNDGSAKVGYLAPSVEGQARAITEALTIAGVEPETISYVEAHGTGTIVGDPIEVLALTQAYRQFTQKTGFCALGSVKSNLGHLGEAAGMAAFIKAVLMLQHRQIPPSLHYETPNPQIDFAGSPFFVNAKLIPWPASAQPRRAGITSLGAGGTNCHVIVEEPPVAPKAVAGSSKPWRLLVWSAATEAALDVITRNLADHLRGNPELVLADIAFTLHLGRASLPFRRALVCRTRDEANAGCESGQGVITSAGKAQERPVAFLFPGQGAQYPNMGRGLSESEPFFRAAFDEGADLLQRNRGIDLRAVIFGSGPPEQMRQQLNQTALAQPALFLIEYALARLWMGWGLSPRAMLGHSIGEYVAACLAGVFSLQDAIALVADRGRLMQQAPRGAMLAVPLDAAHVKQLLLRPGPSSRLCLAAVNAPNQVVVAGADNDVAAWETELQAQGIQCQRLETSHGFHSVMMEPILGLFGERVRSVALHPPTIPYLSNLTGTWIRPEEAVNPDYWVRHLRNTVQFSACVSNLMTIAEQVLLEVGPGRTLGGLMRQSRSPIGIVQSLGRSGEEARDQELMLRAYGQLWAYGCKLDAAQLFEGETRRRVPLPTYPFERQRHWIEADKPATLAGTATSTFPTNRDDGCAESHLTGKQPDLTDWFFLPTWKRSPLPAPAGPGTSDNGGDQNKNRDWLFFLDEGGLGLDLIKHLHADRNAHAARPREASPEVSCLEAVVAGEIDSLSMRPKGPRRDPAPGEVEIRVAYAALNFADVLKVTDVFPEAPFGMECSGLIERMGPGVSDFSPGDEVVAIGPDSFRTHVSRLACLVARKPDFLTLEEAATLPAAFVTAWYALHHVGKLRSGEKVLLHAASGGVGLAAVQVANVLHAEIFATAGSKEKRAFLQSLGIKHVFDSRSPGFAEEVMRATAGKGVDVVLNSLTGAFIPSSFSVLAPGGRFLELGKREVYSTAQLKALNLKPRVCYFPINLTQQLSDDPKAYGSLLREVMEQTQARRFKPLPRQVFPCSDAARAFSLMSQTRHIGKLVLSMQSALTVPNVYSVRAGAGFQQTTPHDFVVQPGSPAHYQALLEALEAGSARIGHIVHLLNTDSRADQREPLEHSLDRGFFSLTWLAKAIGSRDWTHPLDVAVVSTGVYELAGEASIQPAKATLQGPCRVIPHEFPNVSCRSIDVEPTESGSWQRLRLVRQLLAQVLAHPQDRVVAYRNMNRWVQVHERARILPRTSSPGLQPLRHGGAYLITGGLGGLGLELAEYLARTVQAKLILIGRSPLPPAREWDSWLAAHETQNPISEKIRRLQTIEKAGGTVLTIAADITDRERMGAVITEARRRFGELHGIIHTAGTLDDGLIQLKTPESAWGVLAPKVLGTLVLDDVLKEQPLDFFVLFSSVSSILGLDGQVDYTAANAFLDAFAAFRSARCPGQTIAINWSAWQEVGMAAKAAQHVKGQQHHFSAEMPGKRDGIPGHHPWLERRHDEPGAITFITQFSRARQWLLAEHALRGGPALIPGTGFLELARGALAEVVSPASAVELSRVIFQAPFAVTDGETKELAFTMQPADTGWDFRILSRSRNVIHATGHVAAASASGPGPRRLDIAAISSRCTSRTEVVGGFLRQSFMDFGPRWANVREIRYGQGEAVVMLELPQDYTHDLESFPLHPALLDMATGAAQALIPGFEPSKDFYVPFSYGRVVLWNVLARRLYSHVRLREKKGHGLVLFDVTIAGEDGSVLAEISEFMMKRVSQLAMESIPSEPVVRGQESGSVTGASLAAEVLRFGIAPREGIEAFERILAWGEGPQIIVSPVDPRHWMNKADARAKPNTSQETSSKPRPTKRSDSPPNGEEAARGDSIETALKKLYSQLLGVDQVGTRDDFFELGGHSLLAVRLLTRIEKEFKKAISLAELFQNPTIEKLAAIVRGNASPTRKESKIIVPFNEHGKAPAFYCVHSVGGEVASFRHLARLLGPEYRFYGIQAPPELQQDAEFTASIESMASCYLDALFAFQPDGPYVLGGWSAGSTIALEMAQRLIATGRKVELLIAIDGAPFNSGAETSLWNPIYYAKLLRNFPRWVADDLLLGFSIPTFSRRVWNKIVALTRKLGGTLRGKKVHDQVSSFMDISFYSSVQTHFMNAVYKALCTYVSKSYPGRVVLYQSRTEPLYHLLEVDRVWSKVAAHVDCVLVRGTHVSIVQEPYVRHIADDLRNRLSKLAGGDV